MNESQLKRLIILMRNDVRALNRGKRTPAQVAQLSNLANNLSLLEIEITKLLSYFEVETEPAQVAPTEE